MSMDPLLLPLFVVNILLVLVDASVGYHLAPLLFQAGAVCCSHCCSRCRASPAFWPHISLLGRSELQTAGRSGLSKIRQRPSGVN